MVIKIDAFFVQAPFLPIPVTACFTLLPLDFLLRLDQMLPNLFGLRPAFQEKTQTNQTEHFEYPTASGNLPYLSQQNIRTCPPNCT